MALRNRATLRQEENQKTHDFVAKVSSPLVTRKPSMIDQSAYYEIRQAIEDAIAGLQDVLPALQKEDRLKLYELIGPIDPENTEVAALNRDINIDDVAEQYRLVQHIRSEVLSPANTIKHGSTARELTALTGAISNLCGMFFRQQDKIRLLQEVQSIKRAVNVALETCEPQVKMNFISALERARHGTPTPIADGYEGGMDDTTLL
jgi:hypothetical protein